MVQEEDHNLFKRQESDLLMVKEISLTESLCGFKYELTHLDGHKVLITNPSGKTIKVNNFLYF